MCGGRGCEDLIITKQCAHGVSICDLEWPVQTWSACTRASGLVGLSWSNARLSAWNAIERFCADMWGFFILVLRGGLVCRTEIS